MTYSDEKHIDEIIDKFNFVKVEEYMKSVNWGWGIGNVVPSLTEMKSSVLSMLMRVCKEENGYWLESGGFMVIRSDDSLRLLFLLTSTDSYSVNFNDNYEKDKKQCERKEKLKVIDEIST